MYNINICIQPASMANTRTVDPTTHKYINIDDTLLATSQNFIISVVLQIPSSALLMNLIQVNYLT
jgi:hypothetical protein